MHGTLELVTFDSKHDNPVPSYTMDTTARHLLHPTTKNALNFSHEKMETSDGHDNAIRTTASTPINAISRYPAKRDTLACKESSFISSSVSILDAPLVPELPSPNESSVFSVQGRTAFRLPRSSKVGVSLLRDTDESQTGNDDDCLLTTPAHDGDTIPAVAGPITVCRDKENWDEIDFLAVHSFNEQLLLPLLLDADGDKLPNNDCSTFPKVKMRTAHLP